MSKEKLTFTHKRAMESLIEIQYVLIDTEQELGNDELLIETLNKWLLDHLQFGEEMWNE